MERYLSAYQRALDFLFARTGGGVKVGLERTEALLRAIGNPHESFPSFHVAGTNGKGSVCATLEALLLAKGLRVGKYTSPHLVDFRERITVDGVPISEEAVVAFVKEWTPACESVGATFFEAATALAFQTFATSRVDIAVIEVGLGGRLDSTNVVRPVAAGVTSIGMDHAEWLGESIEAIAREKAGIYKPGVPAVIGELDPVIGQLLATRAAMAGADPVRAVAAECSFGEVVVDGGGTTFEVEWRGARRLLRTPLAGAYQAQNTMTALVLLDAGGPPYNMSLDEAAAALPGVRLAGRFDRHGTYLFDVAHNPAGAQVLAETIRKTAPPRPLVAVFGVLGDKDWRGMMRALAPVVDHFVLTSAPTAPAERAWRLDDAVDYAGAEGWSAEPCRDFDLALRVARGRGATVLVTGSFHTVGDAMARLQLSPTPA